jgi:hypothetical protein
LTYGLKKSPSVWALGALAFFGLPGAGLHRGGLAGLLWGLGTLLRCVQAWEREVWDFMHRRRSAQDLMEGCWKDQCFLKAWAGYSTGNDKQTLSAVHLSVGANLFARRLARNTTSGILANKLAPTVKNPSVPVS